MKRSDCLAVQTLLQFARQRPGNDAERCRLVFEHLDTTALLHAAIQNTLGHYHLSELQFGVVAVLFSLDPEPVTTADLATHTAVTRSSITEAIDHLEAQCYVTRVRERFDRRVIRVRLTPEGLAIAEPATAAFLGTLADTTRFIDAATCAHLLGGYGLLQAAAASAAP